MGLFSVYSVVHDARQTQLDAKKAISFQQEDEKRISLHTDGPMIVPSARRLRRACGAGARAVTDADWPACPRFEAASAATL
jgi:hypothetical protein